jgi:hypothetical protein
MRTIAASLGVVLAASACGDRGGPNLPATPTPVVVAPPAPPGPTATRQPLGLGAPVTGALTFHGDRKLFEVRAPANGVLIVRVSFDARAGRIELQLQGERFPSDGPQVVGRVAVSAGRIYHIDVADGAPWDYGDFSLPFELTATFELSSRP